MKLFLSVVCTFLCVWFVSADLTLEVLDEIFANQAGARCLDGSPGSFHFEQGAETKKWVLYMEGGGSCSTEQECSARAQTDLGSSTKQPQTITTDVVASSDPNINPGFWNWTHVRMDYCSGDRWAGTRVNASVDSWGFYFAGHAIFKAILERMLQSLKLTIAESLRTTLNPTTSANCHVADLVNKYQLDEATEILFHGGSAGALGVMSNIDYLNKRLSGPTISLGMNSGWGVDFRPAWSGAGVDGVIDTVLNLYQGHINEDCAAANTNNVSLCIFPRYVFAYIPNRIFILNSLIDAVQIAILGFQSSDIFSSNGNTYVISLGEYTKLSVLDHYTRDPRAIGLFITTCPDHGIGVAINGVLPNIAFADWYYRPKTSNTPAVNYDNCAIDSVVSLLKANTSLLNDCPRLMQLCTKNSSPNAFAQVFNSTPLSSDEPNAPIASTPLIAGVPTSSPNNVPKGKSSSGTNIAQSFIFGAVVVALFMN